MGKLVPVLLTLIILNTLHFIIKVDSITYQAECPVLNCDKQQEPRNIQRYDCTLRECPPGYLCCPHCIFNHPVCQPVQKKINKKCPQKTCDDKEYQTSFPSCTSDSDCSGSFTCCQNCLGESVCMKIYQEEESKLCEYSDSSCKRTIPFAYSQTKFLECSSDNECDPHEVCCSDRCYQHRICKKTLKKEVPQCPPSIPREHCLKKDQVSDEYFCEKDSDCFSENLCCSDDCYNHKICRKPLNSFFHEELPKEEVKKSNNNYYYYQSNNEIISDECPVMGEKCKDRYSLKIAMKLKCENDGDCGEGQVCCPDTCVKNFKICKNVLNKESDFALHVDDVDFSRLKKNKNKEPSTRRFKRSTSTSTTPFFTNDYYKRTTIPSFPGTTQTIKENIPIIDHGDEKNLDATTRMATEKEIGFKSSTTKKAHTIIILSSRDFSGKLKEYTAEKNYFKDQSLNRKEKDFMFEEGSGFNFNDIEEYPSGSGSGDRITSTGTTNSETDDEDLTTLVSSHSIQHISTYISEPEAGFGSGSGSGPGYSNLIDLDQEVINQDKTSSSFATTMQTDDEDFEFESSGDFSISTTTTTTSSVSVSQGHYKSTNYPQKYSTLIEDNFFGSGDYSGSGDDDTDLNEEEVKIILSQIFSSDWNNSCPALAPKCEEKHSLKLAGAIKCVTNQDCHPGRICCPDSCIKMFKICKPIKESADPDINERIISQVFYGNYNGPNNTRQLEEVAKAIKDSRDDIHLDYAHKEYGSGFIENPGTIHKEYGSGDSEIGSGEDSEVGSGERLLFDSNESNDYNNEVVKETFGLSDDFFFG